MNQLPAGINPAPTTPQPPNSPPAGAPTSQGTPSAPSLTTMGSADLVFSTIGDLCGADAGVKIMVYGDAGVGKTVLCATLPMPFVVISTENGLLSLSVKNLTNIFVSLGQDVESARQRAELVRQQRVIVVRNGLQLRKAHEWLVAHMNEFRSVGWDSSSETAEVMLNAAKAVKADGRQAYGEVADIIGEYFKKFRDTLPGKHALVIAKQGSVQDHITGGVKAGPDFPGKQLGPQTPYFLDETFVLRAGVDPQTQKPFRYLQTQPSDQFVAKDRSGLLDLYERPDLSFIIDKMTAQ